MEIPLLLHLGVASEAAPLAAAVVARRAVRGGRAWVLSWCAAMLTFNGVSLYLALHHTRNVWLSYLFAPLSTALVLWALSCWQTGDVARLTMRLAIVAVLAVWAVLTAALENTSTFSRAAEPMANLVCLGAAAFTLVARSYRTTAPLLRQDWFWISGGVALYFATWSTLIPLSALLADSAPALVARAFQVQEAIEIGAMLAIARGMMCPAAT